MSAADPALVAATERASDLDRAWFKRHPRRAHRLRRMVPGEHPPEACAYGPPSWPIYTVVKQIMPGTRVRVPFRMRRTPCGCEECLAAIWEQCVSAQTKQLAIEVASIVMRCGR